MSSRKQLSMVLPEELIASIKERAQQQGVTITAYVVGLIHADLGRGSAPAPTEMAEQIRELQQRVQQLEHQDSPPP